MDRTALDSAQGESATPRRVVFRSSLLSCLVLIGTICVNQNFLSGTDRFLQTSFCHQLESSWGISYDSFIFIFLVYVFMWYACTFPITMGVFLVYVNMNPTILAAATACP